MRILLTGGSGQLGRSILDQFSNCELHAPTRKSLDVTSTESINSALATFKPDVIINAAAWTNVPKAEECPDEALKLNVNAVEKLAIAGNKIGAKFVQISTDYVFDGKSSIPYQEDSAKNPLSVYGSSKSLAEDFLLSEFPLNSYIIRTSWLYSKYGNNFVKSILKKLIADESELEVVNDQQGSPTLARDFACALEIICKHELTPGVYHFANSGKTTWYSFAQRIAEYSNLNSGKIVPAKSIFSEYQVKRPAFSVLDTSKYLRASGSTPPNWEKSLEAEITLILAEVEREQTL